MRLSKVRVQRYRSVRDTGWFDVEMHKTILVGPNEAGKTVLLQAIQQINPPKGIAGFDPLRDYPRSEYNDITSGKVKPADTTIVEAQFVLAADDKAAIPESFQDCIYVRGRKLDNVPWHRLEGGPTAPTWADIQKDMLRLASHVDSRQPDPKEGAVPMEKPSDRLSALTDGWPGTTVIEGAQAVALKKWLAGVLPFVNEANKVEESRYTKLAQAMEVAERRLEALNALDARVPLFVLFNNYFRVRPLIHLEHLAQRLETNVLDDVQYDYGNKCLLALLGFSARELSNLGKVAEPRPGDVPALQRYRDQLDKRSYQLNAASVRLTTEIRNVWLADPRRQEPVRLRLQADGQYLKVVVEDELGVEIELDQRSEGFQWLVSFFVVFFAETSDKYENAILLLDEPGLSLHGLKQRDFRATISRLAESNQTLYTTHSPFLVGPDELDLVRVVQMTDRAVGTQVHSTISSGDPAALLPLQEALGYDLAQSLFAQQRNLVLEGLTDYWYIEAMAQLLRAAGDVDLNDKIALVFAKSAGKVVYYATILHAHELKVAALLDSDAAGDSAAQQETLVHTLGNKRILRTKDYYNGPVKTPEIEDLLRNSLVAIASQDPGWDVTVTAADQPARPLVDIFTQEVVNFSKYKLAKAFLRWARAHEAADLSANERSQFKALIEAVNKVLK